MFEPKKGRARTQGQMNAVFAGRRPPRPGALFGDLRRFPRGGFGDAGDDETDFSDDSSSGDFSDSSSGDSSSGDSSSGDSSSGDSSSGSESSSTGSSHVGGASLPRTSSGGGVSAGDIGKALTTAGAIAANVAAQVNGGKKPVGTKKLPSGGLSAGLSNLVTTLTKNPLYVVAGVAALGAGIYLLTSKSKSEPTIVVTSAPK